MLSFVFIALLGGGGGHFSILHCVLKTTFSTVVEAGVNYPGLWAKCLSSGIPGSELPRLGQKRQIP